MFGSKEGQGAECPREPAVLITKKRLWDAMGVIPSIGCCLAFFLLHPHHQLENDSQLTVLKLIMCNIVCLFVNHVCMY